MDGFKAVNDAYGFLRGDEFIVTLGRELLVAVGAAGPPPAFLGHIGGDDFVVICSPAQIRRLTDSAVSRFEQAADALYDEEDRIRRYVSVKSRRDGKQEHGLVTVSIGVALSSRRDYSDPRELVAVASEMKTVAKPARSFVAMDRRTELTPSLVAPHFAGSLAKVRSGPAVRPAQICQDPGCDQPHRARWPAY
jgi:diguanylate cyclase (GGDEF)-like protein